MINGRKYNILHFLCDGVYPRWNRCSNYLPLSRTKGKIVHQTSRIVRKDVERVFRALQGDFTVIRGPAQYIDSLTLVYNEDMHYALQHHRPGQT